MRLAVVPGDGIGPEVVAEGLKVLARSRPTSRPPPTTSVRRAGTARASCCPTRCSTSCASTTRSCSAPSATPACRRASSSAACCSGCGSSSTTTSTCGRRSCTTACAARWPSPARSTWSCVREGTEGPYVGNGGVLRKDTPHEIATEVSLNTAFGVERVVRYAFERAVGRPRKHLTLVHKTNVLTHAGGAVVAHGRGGVAGVPRGHRGLPARRRRRDVLHHRPGPLRRDRHRQPLRRHRHRPRGRGDRRHRAGGQRQPRRLGHQPEHVRAGARLGARHRRPGHRRPDGRRAVGRRCCSTTSAAPARRRRSTRRSRSTSRPATRSGPGAPAEVGDRLAALAGG